MSEVDPCARAVEWDGQTYNLNLNHKWVRRVLSWRGINGRPPMAVLLGFETGAYTPEDCERVLELGLIGAGLDEREAEELIGTHVRGKALAANAGIAAGALLGLFAGEVQ